MDGKRIEEQELSRRDVIVRGGQLATGLVGAGALARTARAAARRTAAKKIPTGGNIVWAVNQDPTALAPFGVLLESGHWGNEFMYDSLLEWDPKLNVRPALAESYVVKDSTTINWHLRKGVMFHNGTEMTAADAAYSIAQQMAPPPPGTNGTLSFFPAIASATPIGKYVLQMKLKKPDASVFGWFAWERWSSIVPEGIYSQLNMTTQGIGTGPFKLVSYTPNASIVYEAWPQFWKPGLPYLSGLTLQIIPQESSAIAALQAGAIDGATISPTNALTFVGNPNFSVLKGLTAAFYELQFTVKEGGGKPWSDVRVRQAINFAINRADLANSVFGGEAVPSGHVPPGYGPWPLSQSDLQNTYEKFDVPTAMNLMKEAGFSSGFSVNLITVGSNAVLIQIAELLQSYLSKIGITVNIVGVDAPTFSSDYGTGNFDWLLNQRGIRGDVAQFVSEFNPGDSPNYDLWFSGYKNVPMWRAVGDGTIQLDQAKRLPIYTNLQEILLTQLLEVPLVTAYKYQVVRKHVKNMYVAYSDFNTGLRTVYIE